MNDRQQKDNDILAHCVRCDASGELHRAEEHITHIMGEERCLRRAMWLMAVLVSLAGVGLGYSAILLYKLEPYYTRIIDHVFNVVAVAALLSFVAFTGLWMRCRHRLVARREDVRRLVMKLLADRSANPSDAVAGVMVKPIPSPLRVSDDR